jgi:hypothetical protein
VAGVEGDGVAQEAEGGWSRSSDRAAVGRRPGGSGCRWRHPGSCVRDGDVSHGVCRRPQGYLLILGQALDVEVQQISGMGMLVTQYRGAGMQVAPSTQVGATRDAADGGSTEPGLASKQVAGTMRTAQLGNLFEQRGGSGSWTAMWARGAVQQSCRGVTTIAPNPRGRCFPASVSLQSLF